MLESSLIEGSSSKLFYRLLESTGRWKDFGNFVILCFVFSPFWIRLYRCTAGFGYACEGSVEVVIGRADLAGVGKILGTLNSGLQKLGSLPSWRP